MLRARLGRLGRGGLPLGRAQPPPPLLRRDALLRARALSSATAVGDDAGVAEDHALKLRQEIKVLGWALGDTLRSGPNNGEESYDAVERMRSLAKDWRELSTSSFGATHGAEANVKLQELVDEIAEMPTEVIRESARAFQHFLALSNTAESHHRARRVMERNVQSGSLAEAASAGQYSEYPRQPQNTTLGATQRLLGTHPYVDGEQQASASPEQIFEALCTQSVEIVLTAHPTEVTRRSVVQRHREIEQSLRAIDQPNLRWDYAEQQKENLLRQVQTLWWTDEIRRDKPTPWKEARQGLEIVATSMWHAVPGYLRRIDREMLHAPGIGKPLPPDVAPIRFASWMGGDRDGNPNVTPEITKEVVVMSRLRGASLVKEALVQLRQEICVSDEKATQELLDLLPQDPEDSADGAEFEHFRGRSMDRSTLHYQPYSKLFNHLIDRLVCHAMPCHAMPLYAIICHAVIHAMPCHTMPCHLNVLLSAPASCFGSVRCFGSVVY
jgi:phosphoenolpyruvate carboxylase